MTCKDCIHHDICLGYLPSDLDKDVWDLCVQGKADEIPNIEERCDQFKDKSKFIEKPFNIGDEVCIITKRWGTYEIIRCEITKVQLSKNNCTLLFTCFGWYQNNYYSYNGNFTSNSIGKTVFLSEEEARKKLEELNHGN